MPPNTRGRERVVGHEDYKFRTATIRQNIGCESFHASMPIELVGKRELAGTSETGRVYEQKAGITDPATGRIKTIRCVTVVLKTPTRDGETEIRILTNLLVKEATALKVVDLWKRPGNPFARAAFSCEGRRRGGGQLLRVSRGVFDGHRVCG